MLDSEVYALETMIAARCEQIDRYVREALPPGDDRSRETDFQLMAFEERRTMALNALHDAGREPLDIRVGRLERLRRALDCSWEFFRRAGIASPAG
ncbi:MAG: hypothetical protein P8172_08920 [Gammaproteobacteria bacterium]